MEGLKEIKKMDGKKESLVLIIGEIEDKQRTLKHQDSLYFPADQRQEVVEYRTQANKRLLELYSNLNQFPFAERVKVDHEESLKAYEKHLEEKFSPLI